MKGEENMVKVKFVHADAHDELLDCVEHFEYPEDVSEEQIQNDWEDWIVSRNYGYWERK